MWRGKISASRSFAFALGCFPSRAGFFQPNRRPLALAIQLIHVLLHNVFGTARILALQCRHKGELQKLAPFLRARCLVGELQELAPEPVYLLTQTPVRRESLSVPVALTPALGMFPPPCFEMCL